MRRGLCFLDIQCGMRCKSSNGRVKVHLLSINYYVIAGMGTSVGSSFMVSKRRCLDGLAYIGKVT